MTRIVRGAGVAEDLAQEALAAALEPQRGGVSASRYKAVRL
jgi:hypothetical protein